MEDIGYRALVTGATGLVGRHLTGGLLHDPACRQVTVIARSGRPASLARASKLNWIQADYEELDGVLTAHAIEADIVYCALGTTIAKAGTRPAFRRVDYDYPLALAKWAERAGARGYILVSSMGASKASRFFYSRVKGELEEAVAQTAIPAITVFRPSLLLGDRAEYRRGEHVGAVLAQSLRFAMAGPLRRYRAVEASAVADAMRTAGARAARGLTTERPAGVRTDAVRVRPTAAGGQLMIVESDAIPALAREGSR